MASAFRDFVFFGFVVLAASGCGSTDENRSSSSGGAGGAGNSGGGGSHTGGTGGIHVDLDAGPSPACASALANKSSVGCDYYAARVPATSPDSCFVAFVANTGESSARVRVDYDGAELPIETFAFHPNGTGDAITYAPFDAETGLKAGEVIVLFLSGSSDPANELACPKPSAMLEGGSVGGIAYPETLTGVGKLFHIATDSPVVAYQLLPFGGGHVHDAGATLLLPTSSWDTSYIAVNAYKHFWYQFFAFPSMNLLAAHDHTKITLVPVADVVGGGGIPAGPKGAPLVIDLDRGEQAQIHQEAELTGSVVLADKPIGFIATHPSMDIPGGDKFVGDADHGELMIPPVRALGSEYVGVMHEPRATEPAIWRIIGAIDGTTLTWSSDVGGPATLAPGQTAEFTTAAPFTVKSQDADHPFLLLQMMAGSGWKAGLTGRGGPEVLLTVPPAQFASRYVFFVDPTFRNSHIVVVRSKKDGAFADVTLDCAGKLDGWQPIGEWEWTRLRLTQGEPYPFGLTTGVGACNAGRHEIQSTAPFGVSVWGWDDTTSYAYPAGMGVAAINDVVIPIPR